MRGCSCRVHLLIPLLLGMIPAIHTMDLDSIPRRTVSLDDSSDYKRFSHSVSNYTTLWLEESLGRLYVGARGAIFALNISNINDSSTRVINWGVLPAKRRDCLQKRGFTEIDCFNYVRFLQRFNRTHLYTCGTYAFHPHCAYIEVENFALSPTFEGKERCPYDPTVGYTGLIVDKNIYTATLYGFHGKLADIKRNFQKRSLKMDDSLPYSLNDVTFIDSVLVTESVNSSVGDDDKIYFFFTEKLNEENAFNRKLLVTRVARVCKSDEGGMRILQKKWTSFLKTRVVCSIPEFGFHFNVLKSIYVLDRGNWQDTIFYGVFLSQWQNIEISAVCQYTLASIRKAFEGQYKEDQESPRWWSRYMGRLPDPRPGSCITDEFRRKGWNISLDLPDTVLDFVKNHPLMDEEVRPVGGRPLFIKRNVNYTKIVVDSVTALGGRQYDVMFIGTVNGWLHKAVTIGSHTHIIEEIQLYEESQPVESLVLASTQGMLYVGSQSRVLQLAVAQCQKYSTCFDCVLARDPYCAWDGSVCRGIQLDEDRTQLIQDIVTGKNRCTESNRVAPFQVKSRWVQRGTDVFLQCTLSSNIAIARWKVNEEEVLGNDERHYYLEDGSLVIKGMQEADEGQYRCFAEENGVRYLVALHNVSVVDSYEPISPPSAPQRLISKGREFIYLVVIAALVALAFVLATLSIYLFCSPSKRGGYNLRLPSASLVELQHVSGSCSGGKAEDGGDSGPSYGGERILKIIPGEGVTHPRDLGEPLPPPPPPPPLPLPFPHDSPPPPASVTPNGLPHVLRKMNGNSYVLLRQASEVGSGLPHYHSFTEELSKMLEKRKHAQLVEKPDESSV
ncbi:semaphorin-4G [Chiloscyllium punctatum]|uniref:semaphorin-4G n=1 Tax=Chiloscyllium punctatum TaxID=137246 RepID=UPI003B63A23A